MNRSQITESFLRCISSHLASRADCRGVTYRVVISATTVNFSLNIGVYIDKHHRKPCHKMPVVDHVILYHFADNLLTICDLSDDMSDNSDTLHIQKGILVPGTYEYRCSIDRRRRRWERVI